MHTCKYCEDYQDIQSRLLKSEINENDTPLEKEKKRHKAYKAIEEILKSIDLMIDRGVDCPTIRALSFTDPSAIIREAFERSMTNSRRKI